MTIEKAQKIFKSWQEYMEIADKLHSIFRIVPESFLPYSVDELEEGLNIMAKDFFESGNKTASNNIQNMMVLHLGGYHLISNKGKDVSTKKKLSDMEVLKEMRNDLNLILENEELLQAKLSNLNRIKESWLEFKKNKI